VLLGMGMEILKGSRLPSKLSGSKIDGGFLHSMKYFCEYCVLFKVKFKVSAWSISHSSMCAVSLC